MSSIARLATGGDILSAKGTPRVLPVETVANLAMMLKMLLTGLPRGLAVRNRVVPVLPANYQFFCLLGDLRLNLARRGRLASK